ncbi:MAG: dienelactone hydrolase family protein [Bdellovibrionales bacterium]
MLLKDYSLAPLRGGKPQRVAVFLHGVGDRGDGGLLAIGQMLQHDFPDCEFICPDAPFPYDMAPPEFGGRQWFSLQSRDASAIAMGVRAAAPILNAYLDNILKNRDLTPDKMALIGFSQGTMMSLYVAPRRSQPIAAVIGYSGCLIDGGSLQTEKRCSPPILLVHGLCDDVVPHALMSEAVRELSAAGLATETFSCPQLAHSIDEAGIARGRAFLKQKFIGL